MKKIYILTSLILLFASSTTLRSQMNVGIEGGYSVFVPLNKMTRQIPANHSAYISLGLRFAQPRIMVSGVGHFGLYSMYTEPQLYSFGGYSTMVNATYKSGFNMYGLNVQWDILREGAFLPYIYAAGGYQHYTTKVLFNDFNDLDNCKPINKRNVYSSGTVVGGGGAGFRWDLGAALKKGIEPQRMMINFSVGYLIGGYVKYLKAGNFSSEPPAGEGEEHDHGSHSDPSDGYREDYTVEFINVPTGQTHQHKVAEVFSNRVSMLQINLGFCYRF